MEKLVLPVCNSREGSSVVTGIFAAHGLWTGNLERRNRFGYDNYENTDIKHFMRPFYPAPTLNNHEPNPNCDLRKFVNDLRGDREAVIKTFINLWAIWYDAFPDAYFVGVLRDIESAVASLYAKGHMDKGLSRQITVARHEKLERLSAEHGFPIVRTSRLMEGDRSTLEAAFEHCGMELEHKIVDQFIEPEKWHFG